MYLVNKMTMKLCIPVIKNVRVLNFHEKESYGKWKKKNLIMLINKQRKFLAWPRSEIIKYQDVMSMWFCLLSLAVRVMDNPLPITTKHNVWHSYIKPISILPKKQTTL